MTDETNRRKTGEGKGMDRRDALRLLAAAPVAASAAVAGTPEEDPARPNVLLIHCHDLGQFLNCYGQKTVHTPNIDALAASGVRFERSFCTAPQCSPSRSSLFTGRYPHNNGVMGLCHGQFAWDLHPEEKHLAQHLGAAGYRTAAVGVVHETHSHPKRCGFDEFHRGSRAEGGSKKAIEVLTDFAKDPGRPFYLQVGFIEPHRLRKRGGGLEPMGFLGDFLEADDLLGVSIPGYLKDTEGTRSEIAELQGSVRHVDEQVGNILSTVRDLGLEESTLVVFTTDHGIAMPRSKCSVYDPGLEVAFILRLPSRKGWHGGIVHGPMISNIDYVPTFLDLVGIETPANVQGRSLAPLLDGGSYEPRSEIFGEITYHDYYDPRRCIRTETHKLIVNFSNSYSFMDPSQSWRPRSDTVVPEDHALSYHTSVELYDLETDPWEQTNLANETAHEGVKSDLIARLRSHLAETEDPILQGAVTSPMHRKGLEALGV